MLKKVINKIIGNKQLFNCIFTKKQFIIINKKRELKELSNSESKQWYSSIKPKLIAIDSIKNSNSIFITCENIISGRVDKATVILEKIEGEAFISGSFLYSKEYNDIDVFIISKRKKEERKKEGIHYNFITKKMLKNPIIQSATRSSISNFLIPNEYENLKSSIFDYMNLFQETSLLIMKEKEDDKDVRDIMFHYITLKNNEIPSGEFLHQKISFFMKFSKEEKLKELKNMIKFMLKSYKKNYLRKEIYSYNKILKEDISNFQKNDHLKYYLETYKETLTI